ncbi:MAG TPA: pitrilysin family protein [Acidimicrobiales bacterium]|nr:pitrilysin family protein [Acidimicrobiales bacterium]
MPARAKAPKLALPVERRQLENGLRVVLSPDKSSPTVAIAVYYDVGFRSEPEGRSGFAHLFEHLMFEGSATLEKMEHARLVQGSGGTFNGSTNSDYTNYFEALPSTALELGLFLEADRMRAVRLNQETLENQIAVVKEEIRVNVMNRPYGGFPWIHLPPLMFSHWNNAHNGYGSFEDLEAATVTDAADFFERYYTPSNAVLAVVGDFDVDDAMQLVERQFATIAGRPAPERPRFTEPLPVGEHRAVHHDAMAPTPAVALGYRVPHPIVEFDDYLGTVVLADVLAEGRASRLYRRLVQERRLASHVSAYVGTFGNALEMRDPTMLQVLAYYAPGVGVDEIVGAVDDVVGEIITGLDDDEVERVTTALASGTVARVDNFVQRALTLAATEQQRDRPELMNDLPAALYEVDAKRVIRAAEEWLRPARRAVLELVPGAAS